jgi:glucan phosphoethanolaminetransferase (alkaline phosphatase superfamily)
MRKKNPNLLEKLTSNQNILGYIFVIAVMGFIALCIVYKNFFALYEVLMVVLTLNAFFYILFEFLFGSRIIKALLCSCISLLIIAIFVPIMISSLEIMFNSTIQNLLVSTQVLISLVGIPFGGLLYYMGFSGQPFGWYGRAYQTMLEEEKKKSLVGRTFKKIRGAFA